MGESSSLFLTRELWRELGGLDERFALPGGGLVNHDLYRRACALDDVQLVVMLGEGTFHQIHGGASTSRHAVERGGCERTTKRSAADRTSRRAIVRPTSDPCPPQYLSYVIASAERASANHSLASCIPWCDQPLRRRTNPRSSSMKEDLALRRSARSRVRHTGSTACTSLLTLPFTIYFMLGSPRIHESYRLSAWRRFRLGYRMYRNTRRVWTGVSFRAHLAMAVKLFEMPPTLNGVVVECGCFRGGTTANLSLACQVVGRELYVYDSFEGLPAAVEGDKYAPLKQKGSCVPRSTM